MEFNNMHVLDMLHVWVLEVGTLGRNETYKVREGLFFFSSTLAGTRCFSNLSFGGCM